MIRALILDFDGLILDTETTMFEAWSAVYEEHGQELPLERWRAAIGTDGSAFEPGAHLRERMGERFDEGSIQRARRRHRDEILARLEPMPGVEDCLREARSMGLGLARIGCTGRRKTSL